VGPTGTSQCRDGREALDDCHRCEDTVNKLLCILFLCGAIGALGLSQRNSRKLQDHTYYGTPVGEERTVYYGTGNRWGYLLIAAACGAASLYFAAQVRNENSRK